MPKAKVIAVIGATGNIGHVIVEQLLKKGIKVRAIARTPGKLEKMKARGAEIFQTDAGDGAAMGRAFEGVSGAFMMIPPNMTAENLRLAQSQVAQGQVTGAKRAGVKHVVLLSSIGAHLGEGTGPILGVHDFEERIKDAGIAAAFLRPCYFMENHLHAVPVIKGMGVYADAIAADYPFPQVATRDIGLKAAELLASGATGAHYLFGPREYSMSETAKILGASVGKPGLKYAQASYEDVKKGMRGAGISESVASAFMEMARGFNEGRIAGTQAPGAGNRGETTLERFAKDVFAPAFGA